MTDDLQLTSPEREVIRRKFIPADTASKIGRKFGRDGPMQTLGLSVLWLVARGSTERRSQASFSACAGNLRSPQSMLRRGD